MTFQISAIPREVVLFQRGQPLCKCRKSFPTLAVWSKLSMSFAAGNVRMKIGIFSRRERKRALSVSVFTYGNILVIIPRAYKPTWL